MPASVCYFVHEVSCGVRLALVNYLLLLIWWQQDRPRGKLKHSNMSASTRKRSRDHLMSVEDALHMIFDNDIPSGSGSDDENDDEDINDDEDYRESSNSSGSDNDGDDEENSSHDEPQPKKGKKDDTAQKIWHWVKKDLPEHVNPDNHLILKGPALQASTPMTMFLAHFDDEAFELLTLESNRYMQQLGRSRKKHITKQEMRTVVGICFYMSVVSLPFRRMYWAPETRQSLVADSMIVNRFEEILSVLHANDNELMKNRGEPGYDRLHKVRPLLDIIGSNFEKCAEPELFVSVDEQIIPFKGRHSLKVYMMKKPKKWGYKVWVQAGQSGYVHRFQFAGDNTVPTLEEAIVKSVGKSGEVVLQLVLDQPDDSYVFFDNYFASPDLLIELCKRKLNATCTIRANRIRKCPLLCQKDIKKKGRGAYDYRLAENDGFLICEWYDNKIVLVASNVHGVKPTHEVRRYDRKAKEYINVQCPGLIKSYNANMGGVDKCDMLLALYRNQMKSTKWYKRIVFHFLDLCVVNAWLLYRVATPDCSIQLAKFKIEVARALINGRIADVDYVPPIQVGKARPARMVNVDARYDLVDHFPAINRDQKHSQRCKMSGCVKKTKFSCRKCLVYLCIATKEGDDCFYKFHHQ